MPTHDLRGRVTGAVRRRDVQPAVPGKMLAAQSRRTWDYVNDSAGRTVGVAKSANIASMAFLRQAGPRPDSPGRR